MRYERAVFKPLGDLYLGVEFGDELALRLNFKVIALNTALSANPISGVAETIPTNRSLGIVYDPFIINRGRLEARLAGRGDPFEDARDGEVDAVHPTEGGVVEGVERDGDPPKAGLGEGSGQGSEPRAVRRQGQVDELAIGRSQVGEHRHEVGQGLPDERLAARDPELPDPQLDEDPGEPPDLLVGQDLGVRQEGVVAAEDLGRHAVGAPEVAAVRDRDPEVAQGTTQSIGDSRPAVKRWAHPISHRGIVPRAPEVRVRAAQWYLRPDPAGTSSRVHQCTPRGHYPATPETRPEAGPCLKDWTDGHHRTAQRIPPPVGLRRSSRRARERPDAARP